jgi:hypothetical protein
VHSGLVHISHILISLHSKCPHLEMAFCWTFWASSMLTFGILGYIPHRHHSQNHFDEWSVHESTCPLGVLINWQMDLVYADLTKVNLLDSCPFVCISWKSSSHVAQPWHIFASLLFHEKLCNFRVAGAHSFSAHGSNIPTFPLWPRREDEIDHSWWGPTARPLLSSGCHCRGINSL